LDNKVFVIIDALCNHEVLNPVTSSFLGPNTLLSTTFPKTLLFQCEYQQSNRHEITRRITVLCILIFIFLDGILEDK